MPTTAVMTSACRPSHRYARPSAGRIGSLVIALPSSAIGPPRASLPLSLQQSCSRRHPRVSHRSSASTSYVLAALRALHVDSSHAAENLGSYDGTSTTLASLGNLSVAVAAPPPAQRTTRPPVGQVAAVAAMVAKRCRAQLGKRWGSDALRRWRRPVPPPEEQIPVLLGCVRAAGLVCLSKPAVVSRRELRNELVHHDAPGGRGPAAADDDALDVAVVDQVALRPPHDAY